MDVGCWKGLNHGKSLESIQSMTVDVHISSSFFDINQVPKFWDRPLEQWPVFRLDTLQHPNLAGLGGRQLECGTNVPWLTVVHTSLKERCENRRKPCFVSREVCGFDYWIGFSPCKHSIFNILLVLYDQWILKKQLKWNKIDIYW